MEPAELDGTSRVSTTSLVETNSPNRAGALTARRDGLTEGDSSMSRLLLFDSTEDGGVGAWTGGPSTVGVSRGELGVGKPSEC